MRHPLAKPAPMASWALATLPNVAQEQQTKRGRSAEMLVPFVLYVVVIVAGIVTYTVIGLAHH